MAAGLLVLTVYGGYTAVAAVVRPDGERAGSGQVASGAKAGAHGVIAPAHAVATQPPRRVDCAVTPCVALTFDDGPVPQTADVVDLLEARGARATFYVVGERAKQYASVLRHATEAGNEIGNHTWSHLDLGRADPRTAARELDRTADAIEEATGVRPATMRPPFGRVATSSVAAQAGLPQVLWSVDTRDWDGRSTASVVARVLAEAQPGGIVLMHDVKGTTRAAVPEILDALLGKGYALVTVSELLGGDLTPGGLYHAGPAPTT